MRKSDLEQAKILLEADYNQFGASNKIASWMGFPLEEFDKEMLLKLTTILVNENSRLQKRWWQ